MQDAMDREAAGCPHALGRGKHKKAFGLKWCRECLLEEFEIRRREAKLEKQGVKYIPRMTRKWEEEF